MTANDILLASFCPKPSILSNTVLQLLLSPQEGGWAENSILKQILHVERNRESQEKNL